MRDLFEDMFQAERVDPIAAARRAMRSPLRKRFYQSTGVAELASGSEFRVLLDARTVKTPGRHELAAPTRKFAEAIAAEWDAQVDAIDPAKMPLTRLANTIIDGVAAAQPKILAEIEKYLGSDLVLYRASEPAALVERQNKHWDPVLAWARDTLGASFVTVKGIAFSEQPHDALKAASAAIPRDPWRLGPVHVMTTLTGSALIALAVAQGALSVDAAWAAAHVDEDWNMDFWGRDETALARRADHFAEMQAAATALSLLAS